MVLFCLGLFSFFMSYQLMLNLQKITLVSCAWLLFSFVLSGCSSMPKAAKTPIASQSATETLPTLDTSALPESSSVSNLILGELATYRGKPQPAMAHFLEEARKNENVEFYMLAYQSALLAKSPEDANNIAEECYRKLPQEPLSLRLMADVAIRDGEHTLALKRLTKSENGDIQPPNYAALFSADGIPPLQICKLPLKSKGPSIS